MEKKIKLQQVLSYVRRAIDDFNMIEDGDKIAVGISGGKDSLTLLYALCELRRFYPHPYELTAVTVDLGFDNLNTEGISELCKKLDVPYEVIKTDIAEIVFKERKESNPCSLCSKMRKGALNYFMKDKGYNKVAYAHHKDDVVETMMLSMIYEGRFHTFAPVTYLDKTQMTIIRPLIYMNEADVIGFVRAQNLPVVKSPCPADGNTRREYVKELLNSVNSDAPGVKRRMFTAVLNSNIKGWEGNHGENQELS